MDLLCMEYFKKNKRVCVIGRFIIQCVVTINLFYLNGFAQKGF